MLDVVFGCALLVTGAPLAAILLVSAASRREDRDWSLAGEPCGLGRAIARRILACRCDGPVPRPRSRVLAGRAAGGARRGGGALRVGATSRRAGSREVLVDTNSVATRVR